MSESALRGDSTLSSSLFRGGQKKCTNHPGKCFWVLPESEHFFVRCSLTRSEVLYKPKSKCEEQNKKHSIYAVSLSVLNKCGC